MHGEGGRDERKLDQLSFMTKTHWLQSRHFLKILGAVERLRVEFVLIRSISKSELETFVREMEVWKWAF